MYHLFAGQDYYPSWGLGDYQDSYEALEDAVQAGKKLITKKDSKYYSPQDWFCVLAENENGGLEELSHGHGPLDPETD